jgi:uncharacterized protein YbjT (DUF2867 family)
LNILVTGVSGFVGGHLAAALVAGGHQLKCPVRTLPVAIGTASGDDPIEYFHMDYASHPSQESWLPYLRDIDVVINAVGIFRERAGQTFHALHVDAPVALFKACTRADVRLVIQVSALGADNHARSGYHVSKRAADEILSNLPVAAVIVQPSLIYGPDGPSAALFNILAALPVLALPDGGRQHIQPIHIDDVVDGVVALVNTLPQSTAVIPFVGPTPLTLRAYLRCLRTSLGIIRAPWIVSVRGHVFRPLAHMAGAIPGSLVDAETLKMLERGNVGDVTRLAKLLGRLPRAAADFIPRAYARPIAQSAILSCMLPVLRGSIAIVWIWTALASIGLYPVQDSLQLLARVGVSASTAQLFLYGAALLDLVFGLLTLGWNAERRRWLWLAQLMLIGAYTVLITWRLPEFWLHPYGPISKNLPMMAAILLLYMLERPQPRKGVWNTSS